MTWVNLDEDIAEEFAPTPQEQMALEFVAQLPLRFRSEIVGDEDLAHLPRHLRLRAEGKSFAEIASYMGWSQTTAFESVERDLAQLSLSDLWLVRCAPVAKRGASNTRYPAKQSVKKRAATRRRAWKTAMAARIHRR